MAAMVDLDAPAPPSPDHASIGPIVLVGMPGSGKSTVGEALARRLGSAFIDLDLLVEAQSGRSIAEVFAMDGEPTFRRLETEALADVLRGDVRSVVVAPGGGAVLDPENRRLMRRHATVVWLDASAEVLALRVGDGVTRPLLSGSDGRSGMVERLIDLHERRSPAYREAAHVVVHVDHKMPHDVAVEVADALALLTVEP